MRLAPHSSAVGHKYLAMSKIDEVLGFIDGIFRHINNIALCGLIYTVGIALYRHPEWSGLNCPTAFLCDFIQYLAGVDIFIAAALAIYNGYLIWNMALYELHEGFKSKDIETRFTSLVAGVSIIVFYVGLVLSIMLIGAHIQLDGGASR